jgi:hypothetical protein
MNDTQITELAGRHYLISQLLKGGAEVAMPLRDRGIDLIMYLDRDRDVPEFVACPVQLKANQEARFGVERKYEKIPNLLMVYAWNVSTELPELYALTYLEAVSLLDKKGHTKTTSWTKEKGGWSLKVNGNWREMLSDYQMKPEQPQKWRTKILEVCKRGRSSDTAHMCAED